MFVFSSQAGGQSREGPSAVQGRLRDLEGDRPRRIRRGLRGQAEEHGPRLRPQDPQQVGNAQEGGDRVLPGGTRRSRIRRSAMDHQPPFRFSR